MELDPLTQELVDLMSALRGGRSCWCGVSIGNPSMVEHTVTCKKVQTLMSEILGTPQVRFDEWEAERSHRRSN